MAVKQSRGRYVFLISFTAFIFFALLLRFIQYQVLDHNQIVDEATQSLRQTIQISAARGDIVDCHGRTIAASGMGYSVVLQKGGFPTRKEHEKRLETLIKLYDILTANGETINNRLPITDDLVNPEFKEDMDSEIAALKELLKKQSYATARNCVDQMIIRYKLESLSPQDARKVMILRYLMERSGFESYMEVYVSDNVKVSTLTAVKEQQDSLPGVLIAAVPYRIYEQPAIAAHLVGYTGPIYAEEYQELKKLGYKMNEYVGKSGIEKLAEEYLHGKNGNTNQELNKDILRPDTVQKPVPGDTVVLTIDSKLQAAAQKSLEETIKRIAEKGKRPGNKGADANAGAVAVINENNGDIMAAVNYPTYSIEDILNDYNSVSEADGSPLYNRVFQGMYEPGSAYKPIVAVAGLESGAITKSEQLYCNHIYTFYKDYQPRCLGRHKDISLTRALAVSCNCYFYETGRRTTIEKIEDYAAQFGLGQKSGIGLPESAGVVSGPIYSSSKNKTWVPGDTLQAAIGQGDNVFTPLQLANYVATLANGGVHYQPRLIKSVISKDNTEIKVEDEGIVLNKVDASEETFKAVKEGMRKVTTDGTGAAVFGNYPIEVGGKTGSAQVPSGSPNAIFIAFAPYDKPEIAVAIVIEHGWHGGDAATIAKTIFDEYFFPANEDAVVPVGELAK